MKEFGPSHVTRGQRDTKRKKGKKINTEVKKKTDCVMFSLRDEVLLDRIESMCKEKK